MLNEEINTKIEIKNHALDQSKRVCKRVASNPKLALYNQTYCIPSTGSTSDIVEQDSKCQMNAYPISSTIGPKNQWLFRVTPTESQRLQVPKCNIAMKLQVSNNLPTFKAKIVNVANMLRIEQANLGSIIFKEETKKGSLFLPRSSIFAHISFKGQHDEAHRT